MIQILCDSLLEYHLWPSAIEMECPFGFKELLLEVEKMKNGESGNLLVLDDLDSCINDITLENLNDFLYICGEDGEGWIAVMDILPSPSKNLKLFEDMLIDPEYENCDCGSYEYLFQKCVTSEYHQRMKNLVDEISSNHYQTILKKMEEGNYISSQYETAKSLLINPEYHQVIKMMLGGKDVMTKMIFAILIYAEYHQTC